MSQWQQLHPTPMLAPMDVFTLNRSALPACPYQKATHACFQECLEKIISITLHIKKISGLPPIPHKVSNTLHFLYFAPQKISSPTIVGSRAI
jgi:midasin (ATPase involved in ribosome maturation)